MEVTQFIAKHEARAPAKEPDNADQLRLLTAEDGVVKLGSNGATEPDRSELPLGADVRARVV
jgi:hypothetical protein